MKNYQSNVNKPLVDAVMLYIIAAHKGVPRRFTGDPYMVHPLTVAEAVWQYGTDYIIVALLHDVIEDTPITLDGLKQEFGDKLTESTYDAIDRISQRSNESNEKYFKRVKPNKLSRTVKVADMLHNLSDFHRFGKEVQIKKITKQMLFLMV